MTDVARADGFATEFEPFDLSVHLGPDLTPWVSASSRIGVVHGVPRGGEGSPSFSELLDLVFDYTDAVRFAEPTPGPELSRHLGAMVFDAPEVLELFQATRGAAADRGRQLLVRILASPHLASLPWELLPDPARDGARHRGREADRSRRGDLEPPAQFLALAPDAHVARLARGRTYPTPTRPLEPPLHLLIALSSPAEEDPADDSLAFDIFEVKRSLLAELKPLEDAGLLVIDVEDRPTLENLRRRVGSRRRGYHLFHYVGHAEPDCLVLEDESGIREIQPSDRFAEVLRLCPDLRLMVFAGCETARAARDPTGLDSRDATGWRDLLSLADRCVQDVSPVVIGMQAVLPFRTERLISRFFYQGIATGYSIAESMRLARGATRGDRRVGGALLDWSVPVLFLGGSDPGALVPRASATPRKTNGPRRDLKLGLRQPDNRFFARDVALRQAVDVLSGRTRERVLVITGPPGVGKTALIDRALEEVERARGQGEREGTPGQVLYVGLGRLAKELAAAMVSEHDGDRRFHVAAAGFDPEAPLAALCKLVAELLADGGAVVLKRAEGWTPRDWWDRLVEELTRTPFIVVLDDVDLLDEVEHACLVRFAKQWLVTRLQSTSSGDSGRTIDALERLYARLRGDEGGALKEGTGGSLDLNELLQMLDVMGDSRLVQATFRAVSAVLQDALDTVDAIEATSTGGPAGPTLAGVAARYASDVADLDRDGLLRLLSAAQSCRCSIDGALRALADRRSQSRIVISAAENPVGLVGADEDERFEMRIGRLTWKETWRWIRRNLPGLVSHGEEYLFGLWSRLGTDLDRWEALEREVVRLRGGPAEIGRLLDELAPAQRIDSSARALRPRGERALRIAAAGRFLAGPEQVAQGLARLATEHGIGGRVVVGTPEAAGALAILIDEPSPFADPSGYAQEDQVVEWLKRVAAHRPDILLLDYGAASDVDGRAWEENAERKLLRRMVHRTLLVAAGGNGGVPRNGEAWIPGAFKEVLAVGPAREDGSMQAYASRHARLRKPDLFMQDHLASSPLCRAVNLDRVRAAAKHEPSARVDTAGASFAAFHAVAAAVLVWSLQPRLTPRGVRRVLLEAASPVPGDDQKWARFLRLEDALALARKRVVRLALSGGPCSIQTLSAITGLDVSVVRDTVVELQHEHIVRRLSRTRIDRFALV